MKKTSYSSVILRYVRDASAEETLNIGVLLYSAPARFAGCLFDTHTARLSNAFADFDARNYRAVIADFTDNVDRLQGRWRNDGLGFETLPNDASDIVRQIWPDQGLGFRFGSLRGGATDDLQRMLESLFSRMVASQHPRKEDQSRTDADVWTVYNKPLRERNISSILEEYTLRSEDFTYKFQHTFENAKRNIIIPLSLDLADEDSMQTKVSRWVGHSRSIAQAPEVGKVWVLVGAPSSEEKLKGYERQLSRFNRLFDIDKETFEEPDRDRFAKSIDRVAREHHLGPYRSNGKTPE